MAEQDGTPPPERAGWFPTTHWSVVLAARDGDPAAAAEALEKLCRAYWPPIFAFLRREGYGRADAEDLTQAFFAHLQEREFLTRLRHQRGRFRSFLLTFLKNFLADERDRAGALKRGGDRRFVALDALDADARQALEPVEHLTPDQMFEQQWARTVLQRAAHRLGEEYAAAGKAEVFAQLKDLQPGAHGAVSYAQLGARLGLSEGGVKSAVHRLRRRHAEMLRDEIAQTVTRPEELAEEVRHLADLIGRQSG